MLYLHLIDYSIDIQICLYRNLKSHIVTNYINVNHFLVILNRKIDFLFCSYLFLILIFSKHHVYSFERKSRRRNFLKNLHRTYQSFRLIVTFIFRLFIFIDKITKEIFTFVEQIIQIIRVVHGWIQMIRAICTSLHLLINRLMLLSAHIHRLSQLLSVVFQPLSNRTFEKSVRAFSHVFFYYYSSNGACYTLQARTRHIAGRVKARWTRKHQYLYDHDDDNEIYYDAFEEEQEWF